MIHPFESKSYYTDKISSLKFETKNKHDQSVDQLNNIRTTNEIYQQEVEDKFMGLIGLDGGRAVCDGVLYRIEWEGRMVKTVYKQICKDRIAGQKKTKKGKLCEFATNHNRIKYLEFM